MPSGNEKWKSASFYYPYNGGESSLSDNIVTQVMLQKRLYSDRKIQKRRKSTLAKISASV